MSDPKDEFSGFVEAPDMITTRSGKLEKVDPGKIQYRLDQLAKGYNEQNKRVAHPLRVETYPIMTKVLMSICGSSGVTTSSLDETAAKTAQIMSVGHDDYSILAGRIAVSDHHKNNVFSFQTIMKALHEQDPSGVSDEVYTFIVENADTLESLIDHSRDYKFSYMAIQTLLHGYLKKTLDGKMQERPQHMFMRVACGIHIRQHMPSLYSSSSTSPMEADDEDDIATPLTFEEITERRTAVNKSILEQVKNTYEMMSRGYFIHATPTLFNAGTTRPQCSSCFLVNGMESDSLDDIYGTIRDIALISKNAGGIGLNLTNIRSNGSIIKSTGGTSTGIAPMAKVVNATAIYVNQGGKRKGAVAVYMEPWHGDIMDFVEMRSPKAPEIIRSSKLFYGLMLPDIFMRRLNECLRTGHDVQWTLFSPTQVIGLDDLYGKEYEEAYEAYERKYPENKRVNIGELWKRILATQQETGMPYILYKDNINMMSNQKNIGTIKMSNLCTEIVEYTSKDEYAVCNLASVALTNFVTDDISPPDAPAHKLVTWSELSTANPVDTSGLNLERVLTHYSTHITRAACKHTIETYGECKDIYMAQLEEARRNPPKSLHRKAELAAMEKVLYELYSHKTMLDSLNDSTSPDEPFLFDKFDGLIADNLVIQPGSSPLLVPYMYSLKTLRQVVRQMTINLNKVIDINYYPVEQTARSNFRHRPIGIGVQGLAGVFFKYKVPFDSPESRLLNVAIFENIYFEALRTSCYLAYEREKVIYKLHEAYIRGELESDDKITLKVNERTSEEIKTLFGEHNVSYAELVERHSNNPPGAYASFYGSPLSQGKFHFDMFDEFISKQEGRYTPTAKPPTVWFSGTISASAYNLLRDLIKRYGTRNSLFVAPMPTASTAQILGHDEAFEPTKEHIRTRHVQSGRFMVCNRYLQQHLAELGMWNKRLSDAIIVNRGSIQEIEGISADIKEIYKTAFEIPNKSIITLTSMRTPFVDQSQSQNLWMPVVDPTKATRQQFYAWENGLKTGMYYLRSKAATSAYVPTGVYSSSEPKKEEEVCDSCGS